MSNNRISVVMRSRDEERWIGHALQSAIELIDNPEIIVVDNCSSDDTKTIAKSFMHDPDKEHNGNYADMKIIDIEDYSPGGSLNKGINAASGDYILIMSSHCVLTKFNFEEHANDLEHYSALFGNQIPIYQGKKITKRYLWKHFSDERTENMYSDGEDRYFFHNALSFFKKSTLINKPFDENVVGKEDRYWAVDIINSGGKILYTPSMEVNHHYTDNGNTWKGIG